MKFKSVFIFAFIVFLFLTPKNYPWGKVGHKLINKEAVGIFPPEMIAFKGWQDYLIDHAVDADDRRKFDKTEPPKHYIDIDYYKEFNNGRMIYDEQQLEAIYGDSIVKAIGLLPWATINTYNNLINAFKENNRDKALIYAADLAHYIADGHQPFHTVMNYNGQLTNQKGIHGRYEIDMIDKYYNQIMGTISPDKVNYINDPLNYIFNYISNSNSVCNVILDADNFAYNAVKNHDSDEYYRLLWLKTKYITTIQLTKASEDVASLIYSAWVDAGKPDYKLFN